MRFSTISLIVLSVACVRVATNAAAQQGGGCYREFEASCFEWYSATSPYSPNPIGFGNQCTESACGCSQQSDAPGNPQPDSPYYCGSAGVLQIHQNQRLTAAVSCSPGVHAGCRDSWTIRTHANGTPDDVECAVIRSCESECTDQNLIVNGQPIFVQKICGATGSPNPVLANQAEVVGNPC